MGNFSPNTPDAPGVQHILACLEQQLVALDSLGARIAAAHCDAAIQQLRRDQALRKELA